MAGATTIRLPPGRSRIIKRPRLTKILDESNSRILMLVAPAGYGKTTLARQWLEERRHAWYQGGPASADVAALAVGIAEVSQPLVPGAGDRMRARLRATNSPEQDVEPLAELLAEDLATWPEDAWLAIDDYQYIAGSEAAETLIRTVCERSRARLVLTSRERPTWATARQIMYGEIHELSRAALALDQEEAAAVLGAAGRAGASGLVALADGWPAVIGLAASSPALAVPPNNVPDALYEYFAQELYQALPQEIQLGLCRLAAAPTISREVATGVVGEAVGRVLSRGEQAGILSRDSAGGFAMHPLLRAFLLERLQEHEDGLTNFAADLIKAYSERGDWDAAFIVLQLARANDLLPGLAEAALTTLLAKGRLSTLRRWLEYAREHGVNAPILELTHAELAYREGDLTRAQAVAERAATHLAFDHPIRGRMLVVAGKAAQLGHRTERAMAHMSEARKATLSEDDAFEAIWGQLLAAARVEAPETHELLSDLEALTRGFPARELRSLSGRFVIGVRMGTLLGLPEEFDAALHLVPQVADPVSRSGFLITRAQLLALVARYAEANTAVEELLAEAREYRLDFAVPHISMVKALVRMGLRDFSDAAAVISYTEQVGLQRRDVYVRMNSAALRARVLLYQGQASDAVAAVTEEWSALPEQSMHAEYLAIRALALACAGEHDAANAQADAASELSSGTEAAVLSASSRAISALRTKADNIQRPLGELFQTAYRTGNRDGYLLACRLAPDLLAAVAEQTEQRKYLVSLIREAGDKVLARRLRLPLAARMPTGQLTPREEDVYQLLAIGLTNREIAKALFISEHTAKLHTLHILAKLGLRSRTEVALHASGRTPA